MVWYNSIGASDVDDLIFGSDDQVILQRAVKGPEAETTPIGVGFLFL